MNKHVSKLSKEATEARRMIEESDSDDSDAGNDSANEDDMKERNPRKDRNRDRHDRDKTEKVIGLDLIHWVWNFREVFSDALFSS